MEASEVVAVEEQPVVAEEVAEAAPAEQEAQVETAEAVEQKKNGAQKRIEELVAQRNQEREERLYWQRKAVERMEQEPQKAVDKPREIEAKPTREQFDFDDDKYVEAVADWRARKIMAEAEESRKQAERARSEEERQRTIAEKVQTAIKKGAATHEDFTEKVVNNPDLAFTTAMVEALADVEAPVDVAYYLGTHVEESHRIAAMSPARQMMEIATIAARLQYKPAPTQTSAPAPITPVGATGRAEKDPSKMSDKEFSKWFAEQRRKR